jgi:hypothetical protein
VSISSIAYNEGDNILYVGDERGTIYAYDFKVIVSSVEI